jgi:hypothetical protein
MRGEQWLNEQLDYLAGNLALIEQAVARWPGVKLARNQATYLAWIDMSALGLDDPVAFFEQAGVGLSPEPSSATASSCASTLAAPGPVSPRPWPAWRKPFSRPASEPSRAVAPGRPVRAKAVNPFSFPSDTDKMRLITG